MSSEKLIIISSEDKDNDSSNSNSDFIVNLKEKYYSQNVLKVLVKECTIPNVFPNIRSVDNYGTSKNNTLRISINGGIPLTVTLPEGQYLIGSVNPLIDFTTNLENILNPVLAPATIAISYNELTNKIGFEMTGATLQILGSDILAPNQLSMNDVIGITTTLQITNGAGVRYAQEISQLTGYQNVYIHSKEVADTNAIDGDFGLISVAEPVSLANAEFNSYAYKQNNDDELAQILYEQPRNLSRIRITLRDNLGNILPIGTAKINLVLKAYLASG